MEFRPPFSGSSNSLVPPETDDDDLSVSSSDCNLLSVVVGKPRGGSVRRKGTAAGSTTPDSGTHRRHTSSIGSAGWSPSRLIEEIVRRARADTTLVHDRRYHLRSFPSCFVGSEFVDFILAQKFEDVQTREEAIVLAEMAFELDLFEHVAQDHSFVDEGLFYRFVEPRGSSGVAISVHRPDGSQVDARVVLPPAAERLYRDAKASVAITDRTYKGKVYRHTFIASELVDFLVAVTSPVNPLPGAAAGGPCTRAEAVAFCELLRKAGNIRHCVDFGKKFHDDFLFFRFIRMLPGEALARWNRVKALADSWITEESKIQWQPNAAGAPLAAAVVQTGLVVETGSSDIEADHTSGLNVAVPIYAKTFGDRRVVALVDDHNPKDPALFICESLPDSSMTGLAESQFLRAVMYDKMNTSTHAVPVDTKNSRLRSSTVLVVGNSASSAPLIAQLRGDLLVRLRGADSAARMRVVSQTEQQQQQLAKSITHMEQKMAHQQSRFKFGVLRVCPGQNTEDEFYLNSEVSPEMDIFLKALTECHMLENFKGYAGGLTTANCTNIHATKMACAAGDVQIALHVAPYIHLDGSTDTQGVGRKRHVGNDVCVILFRDTVDAAHPFDPTTVTSHFNHVFCIVVPDHDEDGALLFRVAFAYKYGVPPHLPQLPHPAVFSANDPAELRSFLLTKLINAEIASYRSPEFLSAMATMRSGWINRSIADLREEEEKK
jgi:hypothetical protein